MTRRLGGCLGLVLVAGFLLFLVAGTDLPWWAVVYGAGFWIAMRVRFDRRAAAGVELPAGSDDGPRWSSMRGGF